MQPVVRQQVHEVERRVLVARRRRRLRVGRRRGEQHVRDAARTDRPAERSSDHGVTRGEAERVQAGTMQAASGENVEELLATGSERTGVAEWGRRAGRRVVAERRRGVRKDVRREDALEDEVGLGLREEAARGAVSREGRVVDRDVEGVVEVHFESVSRLKEDERRRLRRAGVGPHPGARTTYAVLSEAGKAPCGADDEPGATGVSNDTACQYARYTTSGRVGEGA